jgi:hypothetical protein
MRRRCKRRSTIVVGQGDGTRLAQSDVATATSVTPNRSLAQAADAAAVSRTQQKAHRFGLGTPGALTLTRRAD